MRAASTKAKMEMLAHVPRARTQWRWGKDEVFSQLAKGKAKVLQCGSNQSRYVALCSFRLVSFPNSRLTACARIAASYPWMNSCIFARGDRHFLLESRSKLSAVREDSQLVEKAMNGRHGSLLMRLQHAAYGAIICSNCESSLLSCFRPDAVKV